MTNRRSFLLGLGTALAAPAVVRAESLMNLWVPPAPDMVWLEYPLQQAIWSPKQLPSLVDHLRPGLIRLFDECLAAGKFDHITDWNAE